MSLMKKNKLSNLLEEPALAYETSTGRMELVELSRNGIKKKVLENLAASLGVPMKNLAKLLPVTERTLQRRSAGSLLSSTVSEHAILIGEVIARGLEVFDNESTFQKWMHESNISLGGYPPFTLLDTAIGAQLVQEELGKLEFGVYS